MSIAEQQRALRILFDTYWSPNGWNSQPSTPPDDLAFARTAGIMFEPIALDHDEEIQRALRARDAVTARQVGHAFLASLNSRRLDLRSALGSFAENLRCGAIVLSDPSTRMIGPIPSGGGLRRMG